SQRGIIDPFVVASGDRNKGVILAKELISILTGYHPLDLPVEAINPICEDVAASKNPSFTAVVSYMRSFHQEGAGAMNDKVRGIGVMLNTISKTPFGKLLFANEYEPPKPLSL